MSISEAISRAFSTALAFLGDPARAEALVLEAIRNLDPARVTDKAIRDLVVSRLVQAQLQGAY